MKKKTAFVLLGLAGVLYLSYIRIAAGKSPSLAAIALFLLAGLILDIYFERKDQ